MDSFGAFDWGQATRLVADHRLFFELTALVLASVLAGFLLARSLYRAKVAFRTTVLREELAKSRRRLSLGTSAAARARRDRDRLSRMYRRIKRSAAA